MTLVTEPMNVHQAIRRSKNGLAVRWNRKSKKTEYARKTVNGVRIVSSVTDPTVVRSLSPEQELTRGWTPYDPKVGR
jgi:hypothetical protein